MFAFLWLVKVVGVLQYILLAKLMLVLGLLEMFFQFSGHVGLLFVVAAYAHILWCCNLFFKIPSKIC